jgi:mono/diheme cytochrome c family protein
MSSSERNRGARVLTVSIAAASMMLFAGGCRQEMYDQPKSKPLAQSRFFSDERSSRPLLEGTIAREDPVSLELVTPAPSEALLARGRERYDIYCSPCHDRTGFGRGMIVRRGFPAPPSFHDETRPSLTPEEIFGIITNGKGEMYPYGSRVPPADRWAIALYVKALQLSQHASLADVPPEERQKLTEER